MITCKYCREEIRDNAKKCIHCGSSLTFTGRLTGFWIPVVSFTIATLTSVNSLYATIEKNRQEVLRQTAVEERNTALHEKDRIDRQRQYYVKRDALYEKTWQRIRNPQERSLHTHPAASAATDSNTVDNVLQNLDSELAALRQSSLDAGIIDSTQQ